MGYGLVTVEVPRSHSDTPQSVELLCTSNRPFAEPFYLTTRNIRNRQTSVPLAGFEPATPAGEQPHPHALDRAGTGIAARADVTKAVKLPRTLNNH